MPLLSRQEYLKKEFDVPYTLVINSGENLLYYFGERHSFDPQDLQWEKQKEFFSSFLKDTEGKKRIVFMEGGVRPVEETEEKAILNHGGMGLASFEAHKHDIPIFSPEPDEKYKRAELEKEFSRDEIQFEDFLGVALQWTKKIPPRPDVEQYHQYYLDRDKKSVDWLGYDFTFKHMKELYEKFANKPFDPEDKQAIYDLVNPYTDNPGITNKVSLRSAEIRDEYIVKQIVRHMNEGFSIFAQFGSGHVIVQEPLLRELL